MSLPLKRVLPSEVKALSLDPVDDKTRAGAAKIVNDVLLGGESKLLEYAVNFGDIKEGEPYVLDRATLESVYNSLPVDQRSLLERISSRIRTFAEAQRASIQDVSIPVPGGSAGHTVSPCRVAGCYAPGGRYPLPSSVLMTAITARVAGVQTVWVASPRPAAITIAAAFVAGADALLCIGGAQAIAAMAFGVGQVPACDVIVGPGNKWVTAAKSIVSGSGRCAIDMLAGPSECLVLADASADAAIIAADLLAQAEHDPDALPILVATDEALVQRVEQELFHQLEKLPTKDVASLSMQKGFAVVCDSMEEAISVSDTIAPEHLEIQVQNSDEVWKKVNNYGGLFVGTHTAEVFGDYGVGPNHVLPTGGTAKYTGGLSVFTFLRIRTWLRSDDSNVDKTALKDVIDDTAALARLEGLYGHEAAALIRNKNL